MKTIKCMTVGINYFLNHTRQKWHHNVFNTIPKCCAIFQPFESCLCFICRVKCCQKRHSIAAITQCCQFACGSTKCFGTYHAELTKPKKIQPVSWTVCMDKCHLSASFQSFSGSVGNSIWVEFITPRFCALLLCRLKIVLLPFTLKNTLVECGKVYWCKLAGFHTANLVYIVGKMVLILEVHSWLFLLVFKNFIPTHAWENIFLFVTVE